MFRGKAQRLFLPTLILPTMVFSLFGINCKVFASDAPSIQPKLWSLEETKTIFEDFKNQLTTACGDDRVCRLNFLNELKKQDFKYGVVSYFANSAFMITSVNPDQNTIKVYYNNFDYQTWERRGEEVYRDLTELYICWLDPDFEVWQFSANLRQGNEMPGLHPITRISANINNGDGLPFLANEEIEISVPGAAKLTENIKKNLYYSAWTGFGSNYTSNSDYSACMESLDYEPNAECKIMFQENGQITYQPFKTEEISATPDPIVDGEEKEQGISDINSVISEVKISSSQKNDLTTSSPTLAKPNTGVEISEPESVKEVTIPWWFVVLLIVGIAILYHFFGPQKVKKTLDKDKPLR